MKLVTETRIRATEETTLYLESERASCSDIQSAASLMEHLLAPENAPRPGSVDGFLSLPGRG
jgi:hypothetical protein